MFNKRLQHWSREEESDCDSSLVSNVIVLIAELVTESMCEFYDF